MNTDWQATIQQAYRSFLAGKSIKPRQGQMQMVADLAKSFYAIQEDAEGLRTSNANNLADHIIVIEAGTGTGKTLAYLLATLPIAKLKDKKLVISTATVALQEQLLNKDLPDLLELTDLDFKFALAKGRGRYLCTQQLVKALDSGTASSPSTINLFEQEVLAQQPLTASQTLENLAEAFTTGKWDGDKDSLTTHPPAEVWARLTTDHQRCKRKNCPHFANACPFYNARRELEDADLIVANHDLVLADLALGGGKILPEPAHTYYVFDEAHHLAGKALNHFSANFRFNASLKWLNLLKKNLPELLKTFPLASFSLLVNQLDTPLNQLSDDLTTAFEQLSQLVANNKQYVFKLNEQPASLSPLTANLANNFNQLAKNLSLLTQQLTEAQDPDKNPGLNSEEAEKWQPSLALLNQRAASAAELWRLFSHAGTNAQGKNSTPLARWVNQLSFNQGEEELEVNASPVSAAEALTQQLWQTCYGAALTSATLTALGKFNRLHLATGLASNTPSRIYPSPFNYPQLGVIEVPKQACDPRNSEAHTQAILDYLVNELNAEKVAGLVLFTSRRQMNEVYELLPRSLTKITYTQDELPKSILLSKHQQRINQNQPSLLFGLASLAEGIDLPGKYLTHLIITRLPFASPDDPIEATLAQWLEEQGRKPFFEISVPDASIRLIQACGRLIRTETDTGKITILDQRLIKQGYGQDLLNSLPPFRRQFYA